MVMKHDKTLLLLGKDESYLIKAGNDINTKSGIIKSKDLLKSRFGGKIKTHLGKEFLVAKPTILDMIHRKFKRGAQVILPKDMGMILAYTGISPDSLIVDAGTGSAYLSVMLANFLPNGKIVTYEKDKRFVKVANENIKVSGLMNVKLKRMDIFKGISEKNVDLVTLDLQYPERVVKHAYKSLKVGGWLVVYSPTIEEVIKVSKELKKYFSDIKTVENIVREWKTDRTTRPRNMGLVHTGWLLFARKLT